MQCNIITSQILFSPLKHTKIITMYEQIRLFATDLDDTLLVNGKLTPKGKEALIRLRQKGIIVVIASGRPFYSIRRIIPDCGLSTDIFVGYHDETEEDHQLSLSLMREVGYDSAFMFKYSERPGTYASKHLPDNIAEEEKIRRLNELIALQTEISAQQNKKDEGKEFDVLVEGFSKRSREQLCGRTEQNKMVVFNKGNHHIGETVRVRITGSTSATLFGEEV